jgi:predicted  nucleic acid-binding Zn-ribbon protein
MGGATKAVPSRRYNDAMTTELEELKTQLDRLSREVTELKRRVRDLQKDENGEVPSLVKARGLWKGANFTEEEIDAAKIRVKDLE